MISVGILGNFSVATRHAIRLRFRRSKALLAYLAFERQPAHRDKLCDLLWSRSPREQARANLRQCAQELRRAFEGHALLQSDREMLSISADIAFSSDFETAVDALSGNGANFTVIRTWRGQVLGDLDDIDPQFDEWLYFTRIEVVRRLTDLLEEAIAGDDSAGRASEAAAILHRIDPANEAAVRRLMLTDAASGRIASALRTFNHYDRYLRRTFDVPPSPQLRELRRSVGAATTVPSAWAKGLESARALAPIQGVPSPLALHSGAGGLERTVPQKPAPSADIASGAVTPFVGRYAELLELQKAYEEALNQHGMFVRVSGEPGIGKTRLVLEFANAIHATGDAVVLRSGIAGANLQSAYVYVRGFFEDLLRQLEHPQDASHGALGKFVASGRAVALDRVLQHLQLTNTPPQTEHTPGGGDPLSYDFAHLVCDALDGLSELVPIVLIADDCQFADADSTTVLRSVLSILPFSRILIIATAWDYKNTPLRTDDHPCDLRLGRLEEIDATKFISHHLPNVMLDPERFDYLARVIGGHPLLLEEALRSGIGTGAFPIALPARGETMGAQATEFSRVQVVVQSRLATLSHDAHAFLGILSCFTAPIPASRVETLAKATRRNSVILVRELIATGLLRSEATQDEMLIRFNHELVRRGVYETMPASQMAQAHAVIFSTLSGTDQGGRATEVGERAYHAFHAGDLLAAFAAYVAAGREFVARSGHHAALEQFNQAIAISESAGLAIESDAQCTCYLLAAQSSIACGHLAAARDLFARAITASAAKPESSAHGRALVLMAGLQAITGELAAAVPRLETAKAFAAAARDHELLLQCSVQAGICDFVGGRFSSAIAVLEDVAPECQLRARDTTLCDGVSTAVDCFGYLGMSLAQLGHFESARTTAFKACAIARETGRSIDVAFAEFYRQYVLSHQGSTFMSISLIKAAIFRCDADELVFARPWLQGHLGLVHELNGDIRRGAELHEHSLHTAKTMGLSLYEAYDTTALSRLYFKLGDIDKSKSYASRAIDISERGGYRSVLVWALRNMALAASAHAATRDQKLKFMDMAVAVATELAMRPDLAHLYLYKAQWALDSHDHDAARRHIDYAETTYRDLGMDHWLGEVRRIKEMTH